MQWLIVGLGNPGQRYDSTRHNAGFITADRLAQLYALDWKEQTKFDGRVASNKTVMLLKPETFMNASGTSVRKVFDFFKLAYEQLVIIHDDLDIPLGQVKVAWGRGPHIHNGLLSIEQQLGTKEFWRVRIGVDNRTAEERRAITGERYVLKALLPAEKKMMEQGVSRAVEIVADIMKGRYAVNR
jgi:peptidyl-tRNA hydrolase, PTH1 family